MRRGVRELGGVCLRWGATGVRYARGAQRDGARFPVGTHLGTGLPAPGWADAAPRPVVPR